MNFMSNKFNPPYIMPQSMLKLHLVTYLNRLVAVMGQE